MKAHRIISLLASFALPSRIPARHLLSTASRYASRSSTGRVTALAAAPSIPFFGALFSSSAKADSGNNYSDNMSYPDKRSDSEWRAVLSPGSSNNHSKDHPLLSSANANCIDRVKNNSASSAKKAPNDLSPANTTPTTPRKASTPALAAMHRSTKPHTSSSPGAAGRRTLMRFLVR